MFVRLILFIAPDSKQRRPLFLRPQYPQAGGSSKVGVFKTKSAHTFASFPECQEFSLYNVCLRGSFTFIFVDLFQHKVACVTNNESDLVCEFDPV